MATLQSGKCFTVPTFFGMCCRSEWQERMYIYKWHEVDQTKHEIFCVHIVCNEIQVKVNLEITTFFFFAFSILSQLFLIWGCTKLNGTHLNQITNQRRERTGSRGAHGEKNTTKQEHKSDITSRKARGGLDSGSEALPGPDVGTAALSGPDVGTGALSGPDVGTGALFGLDVETGALSGLDVGTGALSGLDMGTGAISQIWSGARALSRLWSGARAHSLFLLNLLLWAEVKEISAVILRLGSETAGGLESGAWRWSGHFIWAGDWSRTRENSGKLGWNGGSGLFGTVCGGCWEMVSWSAHLLLNGNRTTILYINKELRAI